MFHYWYSPAIVQKFIKWITPKSDSFTCIVTKQWDGSWTFTKGFVKDEPFVGGSDFVIDTIYCDKTYSVAEEGAKAVVTVNVNKPAKYDTCFSDPVPCTNGHMYTCSATQAQAFVCDVKDVFMSSTDKFFITIDPIK